MLQGTGKSHRGETEPDDHPGKRQGWGAHSPLPGMSLPPALAVRQKKTVTTVGPDTHICLPFLLTVLAFGHTQSGMPRHSSHSKKQLRSGLSPFQRNFWVPSTVQRQEPPTPAAVPESSFSGGLLVPNVSLQKSEYWLSSSSTSLYNTHFCARISIHLQVLRKFSGHIELDLEG